MFKKEKEIIKADERLQSVAIIMDGNGRWAKRHLLPRTKGHEKGAAIIEDVLKAFRDIGVKYLTLYAFSTENWKRPKEEVDAIMNLAYKYVDKVYTDRLKSESDLAVKFIGDKNGLPEKLREKCIEIENMNKDAKFICNIALNYGGRAEIVNAANTLNKKGLPITEENLSRAMYTSETPDPDLIIRTGGDFRISNFLIWQGAYSEYMILDTLWPDFGRRDIEKCVKEFYTRNRRFGGLDKEDETSKGDIKK
ncbi:MAG: di-trans,poly-cis-decaprenylcistransferase [Ruminococcaceae bacterium]|nr:di-trans,poly-cis-decaprenylcistransferase [Oscillospiraceae bacterium]